MRRNLQIILTQPIEEKFLGKMDKNGDGKIWWRLKISVDYCYNIQ